MLVEIPLKSLETPRRGSVLYFPLHDSVWCWKGSNLGPAAFHAFSPIYFSFLHRHMPQGWGDLLKLESDKWFRCGNAASSSLHIHVSLFFESNQMSKCYGCGVTGKVGVGEMIDIGNVPPRHTASQSSWGVFCKCSRFSFCRKKKTSIRCTCCGLVYSTMCTILFFYAWGFSWERGFMLGKVGRGWRPYNEGGVSEITMQHLLGKISLLWLPTINQHTTASGSTCCCACDECGNHGGILSMEIPILWAWSEGGGEFRVIIILRTLSWFCGMTLGIEWKCLLYSAEM